MSRNHPVTSRHHPVTAFLSLVTAGLLAAGAPAATWLPGPPLNASRGMFATVVDPCGNIIVLGGMRRVPGGQLVLSSIEMLPFDGTSYGPAWVAYPTSLPIERFRHSAVCTNGYLYVIGGVRWGADPNIAEPILQVDRYDFLTQTWDSTSVPPIPYPNHGHESTVDNFGRIWMIGGQTSDANHVTAATVVYDPARPQLGWQTMPSLNTARLFPGVVTDKSGRIWAIGGLDNGYQNRLSTCEVLDPCAGATWTMASATLPAPVSVEVHAVLGADGRIYTSGGWVNSYLSAVQRLDPSDPSPSWTTWASLNLPRNGHSIALGRDGNIYVIGGEAGAVQSQTNVETLLTEFPLADINEDGEVNILDINDFVICVTNGGCP
ncbi:N-acetylneuraminate epimerase [Phycisphaerae bacterium RAS1]|nr:N-acetylneuraminate epimerase [Phycisphaerae bacterium RAS1]